MAAPPSDTVSTPHNDVTEMDTLSATEKTPLVDPEKEEYYGEPFQYDPTFKGPIKDRGCTDILCLILYFVCFTAFLLVGVWAFVYGDPRSLIYPTDSEGNVCGYGDYGGKPNLFFFDLIDCYTVGPAILSQGCPTPQICVATCPTHPWTWIHNLTREQRVDMICKFGVNPVTSNKVCVQSCPDHAFTWLMAVADPPRRKQMICKFGINPETTAKTVEQLVTDEDCAAYYMDSSAVVGRCVPAFVTQLVDSLSGLLLANNTNMVDRYGSAVNGTALEESTNYTTNLQEAHAILDKYGNVVNGTELEKATEYLAYLLNAAQYGEKILQDVTASWAMILVGLCLGMVISFIWILIMRCIAGFMVWLSLFAFVGLFSFGCYYCFSKYQTIKDTAESWGTATFTTNLDYYLNLRETWLAFGILCAVLLGIVMLIMLVLRERICIAVALIKETSRAVGSMVFVLFWPIIPFILQVIFLAYWVGSAVFLAAMGSPAYSATNTTNASVAATVYNQTADTWDTVQRYQVQVQQVFQAIPCDPADNSTAGSICSFVKYGTDEYTIFLQIFQLFMWLWVMNFIIGLGQVVLAGVFASYYWAFTKPQDIPAFPVTGALARTLRYHMGSIAFGSLIIAIIQLIRIVLEYLDHKLKASQNKVAKFFLKCLKCCFWCLEKIMKFINKNAYILIAVYGKNFCKSAKDSFFLIMRNILRIAVVNSVAGFVMFIAKLMIVGAIGGLAFLFFSGDLVDLIPIQSVSDYVTDYTPSLNYYLVPVIIICIGTYVIAAAFFSVYSMGVDTFFLCFLEDLERHDGSPEKPYYMPVELMEILGKKNRKPGEKKQKYGCCGC